MLNWLTPKLGYVYVLTNKSLPGQVKIGYTDRTPQQRAKELSDTSIPHDFEVAESWQVKDPKRIEGLLHERFADHRVTDDREFFEISPRAVNWAMWVFWFKGKY